MRQGRVVRNTYLVAHHRITNVLNQTAKFTSILDIVEKTLNLPLPQQQNQILMDILVVIVCHTSSRYRKVRAYRSRTCLLDLSLISPSETGAQRDSASVLSLGANDSIARAFAFVCWGTCKRQTAYADGGPYLAIFKNKAETFGNRLERTEGICRVFHPTEEQLGHSRCSRLPVRFVRGRVALVALQSYWYMIRNGRGVYIVCGVVRECSRNCIHVLSGFSSCRTEVMRMERDQVARPSPHWYPSFQQTHFPPQS